MGRAPRTLAIASRPNAFIPPSTHDRLMTALLGEVFSEIPAPVSVWFMRSALLIMFRLGVTFEGAVRQLCRLRVCDVYDNHIVVPLNTKRTRWLRVWLDAVTRVSLGSLRVHHARRSGAGGVRKRTLQPLSPLMHLATASEAEPDDKTLRRLRSDLNNYLAELCQRAKLPTYTVHELLPTVRWVLAQREAVKRMVDDRELNLRQVAALLDVRPTSYLANKLSDGPINLQALAALVEVYGSKKI